MDDIVIGARGADAAGNAKSFAGDVYVMFGKASGFAASMDLSSLAAGNGGFVIDGQDGDDQAGLSVATAGDINGDGFDDLLIGAYGGDALYDAKSGAGETYLVYGKAGGFGSSIDLAEVAQDVGGFVHPGIDSKAIRIRPPHVKRDPTFLSLTRSTRSGDMAAVEQTAD